MHDDQIEIEPVGPVRGTIRPPGSKSITNRALVCAALANGRSELHGALASEDTHVMIDSLQRLGIEVIQDSRHETLTVAGCGGQLPADRAELFVANSGTTIRFLTALVASGVGNYRLDGIERMRQRPIGDLLDALSQLGPTCVSESGNGCPPVRIDTPGLLGGHARVAGDISSQYLSGLLMAAPNAQQAVTIEVDGELVSKPYIDITLQVMAAFGVQVERDGYATFRSDAPQPYQAREYRIEPDASAASYFWGAAAVTGGRVTVEGLSRDALQGDVAFCDVLARMGCEVDFQSDSITVTGKPMRGIEVDMNAISDTVQTLAAVALFAEGATTVTGVAHNRHKETDRIGDLARELRRLGAEVEEREDGLRIIPATLRPAEIETYNDHRMAMSLALVGLKSPGVVIKNPACTQKTYPDFFSDLEHLVGA
ncbi:MAG TPA: 3-phosphoshikimate 1-carboxyvinyltransferase [Planctomycetaceae bacterium]|nr:3-phosphoshikimate 1-carboxyvinyltransferase [Planctomycetaceae bacterium]